MKAVDILILEDNEPDVVLTRTYFNDCNILNKVTFVSTVAEAKEALKKNHYDLVMLDIHVPDGSGLEVIECLNPIITPVVVVSSSASDEYLSKARALGARIFVEKPINKAVLDKVVEEVDDMGWLLTVQPRVA